MLVITIKMYIYWTIKEIIYLFYPYSLSMLVAAEYRKCRCNMSSTLYLRVVLKDVKMGYLALAYNIENTVKLNNAPELRI